MHIEVQVALNFVISYLYNKLPRRRVNIFGEELEKALKDKFRDHWYPEKPFKGSAFRCLKTGEPLDPVLQRASRESGVPVKDVLENLPPELAVWVDPGEVSYRIGEKGVVKVLFSEEQQEDRCADREVTRTFNPEAQCFRPIEDVSGSLGALSLSPRTSASLGGSPAPAPTPVPPLSLTFRGSPGPAPPPFLPRSTAPLTFTTATFAQTKFGSTKLKTTSKRANRMSPTEFSNYIKQRALQQQNAANGGGPAGAGNPGPVSSVAPSGARALSPAEGPIYFSGSGYTAGNSGAGGVGGAGGASGRYPPTSSAPAPPAERAWAPPSELAPRYQPLLLAN